MNPKDLPSEASFRKSKYSTMIPQAVRTLPPYFYPHYPLPICCYQADKSGVPWFNLIIDSFLGESSGSCEDALRA
jgi:hypothetical protein